MPYKIRKKRNQNCFTVYNAKTKRVYAKCTTRKKAEKQIRLLRAIKYGNFNKTRRSR
tara:strand:+ start:366 stop:536 length:171 start_codon:yes stop_codon:yes gene_type:complete